MPNTPKLNGIKVHRIGNTIHIPLPRELWREIEGGCSCVYCSHGREPAPAFWDTLAVSLLKTDQHTWTCHAPEYQGARKKREA